MGSELHPGYTPVSGIYGGGPSVSERAHHLAGSDDALTAETEQACRDIVPRIRDAGATAA